jgi:hypothetical protein
MSAVDKSLTAANVQRVLQGALDAVNELMVEHISKKRVTNWGIANQGLYEAERLNAVLGARLRAVGIEPAPSRSKP